MDQISNCWQLALIFCRSFLFLQTSTSRLSFDFSYVRFVINNTSLKFSNSQWFPMRQEPSSSVFSLIIFLVLEWFKWFTNHSMTSKLIHLIISLHPVYYLKSFPVSTLMSSLIFYGFCWLSHPFTFWCNAIWQHGGKWAERNFRIMIDSDREWYTMKLGKKLSWVVKHNQEPYRFTDYINSTHTFNFTNNSLSQLIFKDNFDFILFSWSQKHWPQYLYYNIHRSGAFRTHLESL